MHSRSERANVSAAVLACVCVSKSRTLVLKQWSENLRGSAASMPRESRFTPARAYAAGPREHSAPRNVHLHQQLEHQPALRGRALPISRLSSSPRALLPQ